MKELQKHGIKTEEQTIQWVMNCPFAWGLENRWGSKVVDKRACGGCRFHDWREGCVYGLANLPTERTAIFDEESKTSWFVWRFNCYHCQQLVSIMSFYQNMSSGYYGRCHKCGAFHYYIKWSYATCPEKEKWWYAVGEPDPESIGHVNDGDEKREYQARIPNRPEKKLE